MLDHDIESIKVVKADDSIEMKKQNRKFVKHGKVVPRDHDDTVEMPVGEENRQKKEIK